MDDNEQNHTSWADALWGAVIGNSFLSAKAVAHDRLTETKSSFVLAKRDTLLSSAKEFFLSFIDPRQWKSTALAFGAAAAALGLWALTWNQAARAGKQAGYADGVADRMRAAGLPSHAAGGETTEHPPSRSTQITDAEHDGRMQAASGRQPDQA